MHRRPSANPTHLNPPGPQNTHANFLRRRLADGSYSAPTVVPRVFFLPFFSNAGTFAQQWQSPHPSVNNISGVRRRCCYLSHPLRPQFDGGSLARRLHSMRKTRAVVVVGGGGGLMAPASPGLRPEPFRKCTWRSELDAETFTVLRNAR